MSEFSRFLSERLRDYGSQLGFSKAAKISPGTVTKWLSGENTPNFESCLIISEYFRIDPLRLFRMIGRVDYYHLYVRHFRTGELRARQRSESESSSTLTFQRGA